MQKKSMFYKIYFCVLAGFAIFLAGALIWLHGWLKDYENSQPASIVTNIIENNLSKGDIYSLKNTHGLVLSEYEVPENVNSAITERISGRELTYSSSALRPEGCDVAYTVKSGEDRLMNIYLKRSGTGALNSRYSVLSCEFDSAIYCSLEITMPENTDIMVNGTKLSDADRTDVTLSNLPQELLDDENITKRQTATLKNLINSNAAVTASNGSSSLNVTKSGNSFVVCQPIDNDEAEAIRKFATDASKTYAAYMQNDSSLGKVRKYFDTDCEFYQNIRSSLVIFALDHQSYRFEDIINDEVYKYSDNVYSCRVEFTQVLVRGASEYRDHFKKYIYLKKNGNNYLVIDMQSIGGAAGE